MCYISQVSKWNSLFGKVHLKLCSRYSPKYVRLGDLDYESDEDDAGVSQFNVKEIIVYPESNQRSYYNDIALLKIDGKVEFNQYIQPACLPHADTMLAETVVAIGWGATSLPSTRQSKLQKVQLNPVPFEDCMESYKTNSRLLQGILNETQVCAGAKKGGRDACSVGVNFDKKKKPSCDNIPFCWRGLVVDHFLIQLINSPVCMKLLESHHSDKVVEMVMEFILAWLHTQIGLRG